VTAQDRLIVALDVRTAAEALAFVDELGESVSRYKVGLELYVAEGRALIDELHERDKRVFLDLKLHDIPETVRRAAEVARGIGVEMLTVHASGGDEMLRAAVEGAGPTRVFAVTVLTSLDIGNLKVDGCALDSTEQLVLVRAAIAHEAGCAGVIASALEVGALRKIYSSTELGIVTPGIRLAAADARDDQKRIAGPKEAVAAGADAIVVGRPIRDAPNRRAAVEKFLDELS
jgi:orotidine-5'-phosphate decarboxylase